MNRPIINNKKNPTGFTPGCSQACVPAVITILFLLVMAVLWTSPYGFNPSALIRFSKHTSKLSPSQAVVFHNKGYDGKYYYLVSQDLLARKKYVPAYRYQRIGLPFIAWLLGLGQPCPILVWIILINLGAPALSAWASARILQGRGLSGMWAILVGVNIATVLNVYFSLTSSLMVCFIILGWWAYERERIEWAWICWAFALITRETAAGVILPVVIWELAQRRWKKGIILTTTLLPFVLWQFYLWQQMGQMPVLKSCGFLGFPGAGVFHYLRSLPVGPVDKTLILYWSNMVMVFLAAWVIVTGVQKLIRNRSLESMILLLWGILPFFATFQPLWQESITGLGRIVARMYPFLVLSCRHRVDLNSKALIIFSIALGVGIALASFAFPVPALYTVK